jgi:sensor histidine kinase
MQVLIHVGISALFTAVIECFLVLNIGSYTNYLVQMGNDNPLVQRFAFVSTVSILLFVLVGILIFTIIFLFLQRKTAKDIETLARGVKQISAGDLHTEIAISGEGELAHIAESIRLMEEELSAHIEKERENEQSKTDLITNIAHDLRTPLTSILGYLDLLRNNQMVPEEMKKHYIEIVYNKALRLQKLIEELFGFTKLSYGKLNMNLSTLDLVQLLSQLVEESYPNFEKNNLSYDFSANVKSLLIEGDGDLLARLFDNLISNAIKYGAEGKRVLIRLRKEKEAVSVQVLNFGYVIPEKELPLLFDKFYRVEYSRSLSTGGTGLGLAIVKNIVDVHHGSISVQSDMGGTRFTVTLPLKYTEEAKSFSDKTLGEERSKRVVESKEKILESRADRKPDKKRKKR